MYQSILFEPAARAAMPLNTAVILAVEDNPIILAGALDLIRNGGFDAIGATSADEAITILEARSDIRLVFTDVEMPGTIDGIKLAHYIRERWPPIHLIVASGRMILEESQLPANSKFFSKPYDDNTIIDAITKMLNTIEAEESAPLN